MPCRHACTVPGLKLQGAACPQSGCEAIPPASCFHILLAQVVLDRVKNAEKLPGVSEILLPSERGNRVAQQRISIGMVPIEANLYSNLKVMASKADAGHSGKAAATGAETSWKLPTLLLHPAKSAVADPFDASGAPLYQTATFGQPSATEGGAYDYTRSGNPTRTMLEEQVRSELHMVS